MNKIYKVIWSKTRNCYVVVSELAKRNSKGGVSSPVKTVRGLAALLLCACLAVGYGVPAAYADDTITEAGVAGSGVIRSGTNASAWGNGTVATGINSTAWGVTSQAIGTNSTAFGLNSVANGSNSLAGLGGTTLEDGIGSVAIGSGAKTGGMHSIALGMNATASLMHSIALGMDATASLMHSVAIGSSSVANRAAYDATSNNYTAYLGDASKTGAAWQATQNAIAIGASANNGDEATVTRQITGVAAGTYDTDAVNVAQLKAAVAAGGGSGGGETVHFYSVNSEDSTAGNYDNKGATGENALAAGVNAQAKGEKSISIGYGANGSGITDISVLPSNIPNQIIQAIRKFDENGNPILGSNNKPVYYTKNEWNATTFTDDDKKDALLKELNYRLKEGGTASIAIGDTTFSLQGDVVVGSTAKALGNDAVVLGRGTTGFDNSVAVGTLAVAAPNSIAIGSSVTEKNNNITTTYTTKATANYSIAIGTKAEATQTNAMALGIGASATAGQAIALGRESVAGFEGSSKNSNQIAIGYKALSKASNAISIGNTANNNASFSDILLKQIQPNQIHKSSGTGYWTSSEWMNLDDNTRKNEFKNELTLRKNARDGATDADLNDKYRNSITIGEGTSSLGLQDITIGSNAIAAGAKYDIAIGRQARTLNEGSIAIGMQAISVGKLAVALGANSFAGGENSIAIGEQAQTFKQNTTSIGPGAKAYGYQSSVVGFHSYSIGSESTVFGHDSTAHGKASAVFGYNSTAGAVTLVRSDSTQDWTNAWSRVRVVKEKGEDEQGNTIYQRVGESSAKLNEYEIVTTASGQVVALKRVTAENTGNNAVPEYYKVKEFRTVDNLLNESGAAMSESQRAGYWFVVDETKKININDYGGQTEGGVAFGDLSNAVGNKSLAVGRSTVADGNDSTAIGIFSNAYGTGSMAYGQFTSAGTVDLISSEGDRHVTKMKTVSDNASVSVYRRLVNGESAMLNKLNEYVLKDIKDSTGTTVNSVPVKMNAAGKVVAYWTGGTATSDEDYLDPDKWTSVNNVVIQDKSNHTLSKDTNSNRYYYKNGNDIVYISDTDEVKFSVNSQTLTVPARSLMLAEGGVAMGAYAHAEGDRSMAFGRVSGAYDKNSTAVGLFANAYGEGSMAIGHNATTGAEVTVEKTDNDYHTVTLQLEDGNGVRSVLEDGTPAQGGIAIGSYAHASGDRAIAFGRAAGAYDKNSTAFGIYANALGDGSMAIGHGTLSGGHAVIKPNENIDDAHTIEFEASSTGSVQRTLVDGSIVDVDKNDQYTVADAGGTNITVNKYGKIVGIDGASVDFSDATIKLEDGTAVSRDSTTGYYYYTKEDSKKVVGDSEELTFSKGSQSVTVSAGKMTLSQGGVSLGSYSHAEGDRSMAIGRAAGSYDKNSSAVGLFANAYGEGAMAIGHNATTGAKVKIETLDNDYDYHTVALQLDSNGNGVRSYLADGTTPTQGGIAIGSYAHASGDRAIAFGRAAGAYDRNSTAFGIYANALGEGSMAMGHGASTGVKATVVKGTEDEFWTTTLNTDTTTGNPIFNGKDGGIAIGSYAHTEGERALAVGRVSGAYGTNSTAIGLRSNAYGEGSIAFGHGVVAGNEKDPYAKQIDALHNDPYVDYDLDGVQKTYTDSEGNVHTIEINPNNVVGAIAFGSYAKATARGSLSVGRYSEANSPFSTAMGIRAKVGTNAENGIAIGREAKVVTPYQKDNNGNVVTDADGNPVEAPYGGGNSIAVGALTTVTGQNSIAIGTTIFDGTDATTGESILLGPDDRKPTTVTGDFSLAIGRNDTVAGDSSIAIGDKSAVTGNKSIAIGTENTVKGDGSGAIGDPNVVVGDSSYILGNSSEIGSVGTAATATAPATADIAVKNAFIIGNTSKITDAAAEGGLIYGSNAEVTKKNGLALGNNTSVSVADGVALGSNSVADTDKGVAGFDPVTGAASTKTTDPTWQSTAAAVSVGGGTVDGKTVTRQITDVAAGYQDTDAVNVAQLKAARVELKDGTHTTVTSTKDATDGHTIYKVNVDNPVHFYSVNSIDSTKGNYDNKGATGTDAIAAGVDAKASRVNAIAIGTGATAGAQVLGSNSIAIGTEANVENENGIAIGINTKVKKDSGIAIGNGAIAEGKGAIVLGSGGARATGEGAMAWGGPTDSTSVAEEDKYPIASGKHSTAFGEATKASGIASTAWGNGAIASGIRATAWGGPMSISGGQQKYTTASGSDATAWGTGTLAQGITSTAWGSNTNALGKHATAWGTATTADGYGATSFGNSTLAQANNATAWGTQTKATGVQATAFGDFTTASGWASTAWGLSQGNENVRIIASNYASTAWGYAAERSIISSGVASTAFGYETQATGQMATAFGQRTQATGAQATAFGAGSVASGRNSTAFGASSIAGGINATAFGTQSKAFGENSLAALGGKTGEGTVSQDASTYKVTVTTTKDAKGAVAIGEGSNAQESYTYVIGQNAVTSAADTIAFGNNASATVAGGVALGSNSIADTDKEVAGYDPVTKAASTKTDEIWKSTAAAVSVGGGTITSTDDEGNTTTTTITRQVTNVAAGYQDTDAVNVAQLKAARVELQDGTNTTVTSTTDSTDGHTIYKVNVDNPVHFYSVNSTDSTKGNYDNKGAKGADALAAGVDAKAAGDNAIAIGTESRAKEDGSIAIGNGAKAKEIDAIAIGTGATAKGVGSIALGRNGATAVGRDAMAWGVNTKAKGDESTAWGTKTKAKGDGSTAFGFETVAKGEYSTAWGEQTKAVGESATAWGLNTVAKGDDATAWGNETKAVGVDSTAWGIETKAKGLASTAFGYYTKAKGDMSVAWGSGSQAIGNSSTAFGVASTAYGRNSLAALGGTTGSEADEVTAVSSVAIGKNAVAAKDHTYAIGQDALAQDENTIAMGNSVVAAGKNAVAIGSGEITRQIGTLIETDRPGEPTAYSFTDGNGTAREIQEDEAGIYYENDEGTKIYLNKNEIVKRTDNSDDYDAEDLITTTTYLITEAKNPAQASGDNAIALGTSANASGDNSIAVGTRSAASSENTIAFGNNASATVADGVALGSNSVADTDKGVAGYDPVTGVASTKTTDPTWQSTAAAVSVGGGTVDGKTVTRQITNVAAGYQDTDAVNVAQLKKVAELADGALKFGGDNTTPDTYIERKSGQALDIKGGANTEPANLTDGNIAVVSNGLDTLEVKLSNKVKLNNDGYLSVGDAAEGATIVNQKGLRVIPASGDIAEFTSERISAGNRQINNVAAGTLDSDAVNVSQLKKARTIIAAGANVTSVNEVTPTDVDGNYTYTIDVDNLKYQVGSNEAKSVALQEGLKFVDGENTTAAQNPDGSITFNTDNLTYKVGTNAAQSVALKNGLHFVDGTNTKAVQNADGSIQFDATHNKVTGGTATQATDSSNAVSLKLTDEDGNDIPAIALENTYTAGVTYDAANKKATFNRNDGGSYELSLKDMGATDYRLVKNVSSADGSYKMADDGTVTMVVQDQMNPGNTEQVTISGLLTKADVAAAKTEVVKGTNIASVDSTTGTDGQTIYTVNADGASVSKGSDAVTVTAGAKDTATNITDYKVDLSEATKATLDKAETDGLTFTGDSGSSDKIKLGDTLNVTGGATGALSENNIGVEAEGNALKVKLAKDIEDIDNIQVNKSVTVGDGITIDGESTKLTMGDNITVDGANTKLTVGDTLVEDKKITMGDTLLDDTGMTVTGGPVLTKTSADMNGLQIKNVKAGEADTDAVNVSQLTKAAAAAKTEVVKGTNIASVDSTTGTDGQTIYTVNADGAKVSAGSAAVSVTKADEKDSDNIYDYSVDLSDATKATLNKVETRGLTFKGDSGSSEEIKLGDTLNVTGGATGTLTEGNIGVEADGTDLKVKLADNINLTKAGSVTIGTAAEGATVISQKGIRIIPATGDAITEFTAENISAGGQQIHKVKAGTADDDAVNVSQLKAAKEEAIGSVKLKFRGETGDEVVRGNNETLQVVGDGSNITTKAADDKIQIELSKDLNVNSVTAGNTVINNEGVKADKVTVGDTVIEDGKVSVGDTTIEENKITMGDTTITNNSVTTKSVTADEVIAGDTTINSDGVTTNKVTVGDTTINNDGLTIDGGPSVTKDGIDAGNKKITGVAAGVDGTDAVNVDQLNAATAGSRTEVAGGTNIASVEHTTGEKGQSIYTVNAEGASVSAADGGAVTVTGAKDTATNITNYKVDLSDTAKASLDKVEKDGLTFKGDTGTSNKIKLGDTLNIKGGASGALSDGNIGVEGSGDTLNIKLAKDIQGVDTLQVNKSVKVGNTTIEDNKMTMGDTVITNSGVTANRFTAGDTTVSSDGVTIANGPSVTKKGVDAGGQKVTNVAPGEADTDAANMGQLRELADNAGNAINNVSNEVNRLDGRMKKGLAGAAALAALHPMDFDPDDKLTFAAGMGNYRGQNAAAIGAFYRPDEKIMFSVGGTVGNGENMVNAGVSFALDRVNRVTTSRTAMAHEIVELKKHIAHQDSQIAQLTQLVNKLVGPEHQIQNTSMFPDVPENHWAYKYLEDLQKRGIVEGYPDGQFRGDRSMTRYEFAALLDRALRKGEELDARIAKEFEPELGRIYVERIKGQDNDRHKIERVRVNNTDTRTRDVYGTKIS